MVNIVYNELLRKRKQSPTKVARVTYDKYGGWYSVLKFSDREKNHLWF